MRGNKSSVNLIGQLFVEVHSQKQIGLIFTERIPTFKESSAEGRVSMELLLSIIFRTSLARIIDTLAHVCTRRRVRLKSADGALWAAEEITASEGRD